MRALTSLILFLCLLTSGGCGKKQKSTPELLTDLKGSHEKDKLIAVRLLPQRKGDSARVIPALIEALKDGEADVRRSAAIGLGTFGKAAKEAIPALKTSLNDPDPRVREAAGKAIGCIEVGSEPVKSSQ